MIRLHWEDGKLMNGSRRTAIEVLPDDRWPGMYRVHYQGKISDIVNLTRAKDAAVATAVASLNAQQRPRPFSPTCAAAEDENSHQRPAERRRARCPSEGAVDGAWECAVMQQTTRSARGSRDRHSPAC